MIIQCIYPRNGIQMRDALKESPVEVGVHRGDSRATNLEDRDDPLIYNRTVHQYPLIVGL